MSNGRYRRQCWSFSDALRMRLKRRLTDVGQGDSPVMGLVMGLFALLMGLFGLFLPLYAVSYLRGPPHISLFLLGF